jgi:hypothetical protein
MEETLAAAEFGQSGVPAAPVLSHEGVEPLQTCSVKVGGAMLASRPLVRNLVKEHAAAHFDIFDAEESNDSTKHALCCESPAPCALVPCIMFDEMSLIATFGSLVTHVRSKVESLASGSAFESEDLVPTAAMPAILESDISRDLWAMPATMAIPELQHLQDSTRQAIGALFRFARAAAWIEQCDEPSVCSELNRMECLYVFGD